MRSARRTVVWDLDDVLNDLMRRWIDGGWRSEQPQSRVVYDDLVEMPPHRILGVSEAAYLESLDRYRASSEGRNLPVPVEVCDWFSAHGDRARHIVLTARPRSHAATGADWVFRHFGDWVGGVNVVPSARPDDRTRRLDESKADWLAWLDHDDVILVDDNAANVGAAHRLGLAGVLMPQPWNGAGGSRADALRQVTGLLA